MVRIADFLLHTNNITFYRVNFHINTEKTGNITVTKSLRKVKKLYFVFLNDIFTGKKFHVQKD